MYKLLSKTALPFMSLLISGFFTFNIATLQAADLNHDGQLLTVNCLSCHGPSTTSKNRIAPPIYAVKKHYMKGNPTLESFVQAITQFVINPDAKHTKMPRAIERFGVMPDLGFNEQVVKKIAAHLYVTPINKPEWFDKHIRQEHTNGVHPKTAKMVRTALEKSQAYAKSSQARLGKNLIKEINTKGAIGALDFCHVNAIPLTTGENLKDEVVIRRVSDKNRNPINAANKEELAIINAFKSSLTAGDNITPRQVEHAKSTKAYFPIVTKGLCLQCHGKPGEDITPAVYERISQLYPSDKAIGYQTNELRGMWVIEMLNKL